MTSLGFWSAVVLFLFSVGFSCASECEPEPKCFCNFDEESVPVEPNVNKNEALVGAVGAMSSIALTGSGFFIWQLCKRKENGSKKTRMGSDNSETSRSTNPSSDGKEQTRAPVFKPYSTIPRKKPNLSSPSRLSMDSRPTSIAQTNIYRASPFEQVKTNRTTYTAGAESDWC